MKVLIGEEKDCLDELNDLIIAAIEMKKNILIDNKSLFPLIKDIDFSSTKLFCLDDEERLKVSLSPKDVNYASELLFNPIDIAFISINSDGSIGPINKTTSNSLMEMEHLSMQGLLQSKEIILCLLGNEKADITKELLEGEFKENFPPSLLFEHHNITAIIDTFASKNIDK